MLDALRIATKGWLGRTLMTIVLGFIILSFAIWGIGDIFRGFRADELARVGDVEINIDAYRNAYQTELQRMQRRGRRAITNEEARQLGLDRQVLGRLISEAALDQETRRLVLAMSDQDVGKKITDDEAFKGPTGAFDRQKFIAVLRDNGLTEQIFVREQRAQYLRHQVADSLLYGLELPKALLEAVHRYQAEARSVDYIVVPASHAGEIPTPSQDDLQKFFEGRRGSYADPEYRGVVTLALTPAQLAKPEDVTEQDAQKRYEEIKSERFGTPEKRAIEQILFSTEAEAAAARARLDSGETWEQLLAEKKLAQKDVSLGLMTRDGLADKNIADAAFALPKGSISQPVKTQFGTALVRVAEIEPATVKPFSEVAANVKQEIALQRARHEIARLHDAIEDQRTAGKSLTEAAQSAGFQTREIAAINSYGKDPNGVPVPELVNTQAFLKAMFASDIGVDNDTLRVPDGGYQWFEITRIEPARQKTLEDVRQEVEKAWRDDETAKRLSAKATELQKRLEAGETIAAVAASEGNLEVKHAAKVARGANQELGPNVVAQVFNVGVRGVGSVSQSDGSRIVFQVMESVVPPFDPADPFIVGVSGEIKNGMVEDVVSQYLTKLQNDLGVRVNPKALAVATGAASDNY